jgi:hypothetical protein
MKTSACRRSSSAIIEGWLTSVETRDVHAAPLDRLDQGTEIAIAGEQHHLINVFSDLHSINGKLDVHVALNFAAASGIDKFFGRLSRDGKAIVVQPVHQTSD